MQWQVIVAFYDPSQDRKFPGWPLRNLLTLAAVHWHIRTLQVLCYREKKGQADLEQSLFGAISIPEYPGFCFTLFFRNFKIEIFSFSSREVDARTSHFPIMSRLLGKSHVHILVIGSYNTSHTPTQTCTCARSRTHAHTHTHMHAHTGVEMTQCF